jgi:phasin family protein
MIPFSQFSAGIPQSQFDFFRAVTAKAFASAERVVALNINTSRASVERSSNTVKQLMQLNDPRDLLSLTSQPQKEFQSLLAYSRELLSIVADVGLKLPTASAPLQPLPAPAAAPVAKAAPQPAPQAAAAPGAASAASAEAAAKAPVVEAAPAPAEPVLAAVPEPVAEAKPVAKALSKVAPMPEAAERPLAAPVATQHEIELPPVKPVEAAPPPAPVSGTPAIEVRQAEAAARPKAARKK